MKIGFDLDKIFIDYPPIIPDAMIDKLYKKKANGVLLYRIPSRPEQVIRQISHFPLFRPAIKTNIEFLRSLSKKNYKLYLISSRFNFLERQTLIRMQQLGLDLLFEKMYFNFENKQPHLFKEEVLKKLKPDLYVDDDIHLLKYVAVKNKNTKFFWLHPEPTSVHLPRNITQLMHLPDILLS